MLGGGNTTTEKKSSTSKGSSISTGGKIELNSGNNIKIVNGTLNSSKDTEIIAKNDVSIEAGKNEYSEKTTTTSVGIYADGNAGIGGVGVSGSASTADMSASGEISSEWGASGTVSEKLDGSNEKTPTTSGKPHMDQLVNSEIGLKIEHSTKEVDETTWSESQLKGDNITIKAGNTVDIGGGDYEAKNNVTIKGKKVDTTKYEDVRNEKTDGFTLAVKQSQGVSSSVVDTINTGVKMDAAIKSGQANEGVLAAQGIGAATNLLFNDLAGVFSKQSVNLSIEKSTKNETSENITSIKGKNIDITATEGDINLNGVDIKSEENISLDAKNNINVSAAKKTSSESGLKVDLEAQLEQSAGYSALWGGNTDIGVGGSANVDVTSSTSKEMINSTIKADGNLTIKSGADTNIKGAEIEAKKDANIKVGGNLNIESQKSSYKEDSINANAGGNVSIGAASNTIGKGELGFSAGGGNIWKNGETVKQSGIKSGGNLVVDVGKDLNMTGGVLGSETGNGSLNVGGNVNLKDLVTTEQQGGAHITVSGGFTGDMGVDGKIGDTKDKQVTSKSVIGLKQENINVNGDISLNGEKGGVKDIYTDLENTQIVDKDVVKVGGDISLSGSIQNVKDMKDKINSIQDSISSSKKKVSNVDTDINIKNVSNKNIGDVENSKKLNQGEDTRTQEQKNQDDRDIIDRIIGYIGDESGELSKIKEQIGKGEENYKKNQDETMKIFDDMISQVEKENTSDVEVPKSSDDKYAILDKDNAFDFPKDDGVRAEINDIANETKIVPQYQEPLNAMPPQKNDSSQQIGAEKKEPGYNDLVKKAQDNLDPEHDKKIMEYIIKETQKNFEKSEKELIDLLNKQSELLEKQNEKKLTKKEKKELDTLEKELKRKADEVSRYKEGLENMDNGLKEFLADLEKKKEPIYDEVAPDIEESHYEKVMPGAEESDYEKIPPGTEEKFTEKEQNKVEKEYADVNNKTHSDSTKEKIEGLVKESEKSIATKLEDLKAEKAKNENNPEALKVIKEKEEILTSLTEINKIKDDLKALGKLYGEPRRDIKEYRDLMDKLDALTVEIFKGKKEAVAEKEKVLTQLKEMREKLDKDVMAQITEVVLKKSEKETEILNKLETLLQNGNLSEKDRFVYTEELKNIKNELEKAESFKTDGNSENEIAPPLPPRDETILADMDNKDPMKKYSDLIGEKDQTPDNSLKEVNIKKEIQNNPPYEKEYKKLEKLEQDMQKEREKLNDLFIKQSELSAKELDNNSKKELNNIEKLLEQTKNKINELQKKQNETIANIDSIREKNTKKVTEISIENSDTNNSNNKNEITIPSDLKVENKVIKTEYGDINLTTTDIGVIKNYIESGFLVNDSLRENIPLTEKETKFVKELDEALSKMPSYTGDVQRVLYIPAEDRAEFKKFLESHTVGSVGYTSTARTDVKNSDLPSNIVLNIKDTTSGKDVTYFNKDEGEVIFERGAKFEVTKVVEKDGKFYIDMKESKGDTRATEKQESIYEKVLPWKEQSFDDKNLSEKDDEIKYSDLLLNKNSKKEIQTKEPKVIYADLNELGINESSNTQKKPELPTGHPILDKNEKTVKAKEKETLKKDAYKKEGDKFIRSEEEIKR